MFNELQAWDEAEQEENYAEDNAREVGRFPMTGVVLLPGDPKTYHNLIESKLVTADVAREMHRLAFDEQKRFGTGWDGMDGMATMCIHVRERERGRERETVLRVATCVFFFFAQIGLFSSPVSSLFVMQVRGQFCQKTVRYRGRQWRVHAGKRSCCRFDCGRNSKAGHTTEK